VTMLVAVSGLAGVGSGIASAAPVVPSISGDQLKNFPAQLRALVPGSADFTARYLGAKRSQESAVASDSPLTKTQTGPSCQAKGGDIGLYEMDYVRQFGDLINAVGNLPGQDKIGFVTAPWPGPPAADVPGDKEDGGLMPLAGAGYNYDGSATKAHLPDPQYLSSCAADLAPFGKSSSDSPWGFDYYDQPDQGSLDALQASLATIPARDRNGTSILGGTASWNLLSASLNKWAYSPTKPMNYCDSGDLVNPLCLTAMFLHCPSVPAASAANYQAVKDCQAFNANTVVLNVSLGNWLNINGPDGRFHDWIGVLDSGKNWPTVRKWILTGLIVAGGAYAIAAAGGLAAGLLPKLILAGATGAAVATATDSWDKVWGVVSCSVDFGKCMAEQAAKAMATTTGLVSKAAKGANVPDLATSAGTFNTLAAVSAMLVIIFFLIALLFATLTGRMGLMIPASVGLAKWGVTIGAGSTILTLVWGLSGSVSDAIAGSATSSGQALSGLADALTGASVSLGGNPVIGWLLVAVVCLVGMLAALVVYVILSVSYQFIPLAISLMILQASGYAGPEATQKWIHRGWGMLWMIILLRPAITLVAKSASNAADLGTLGGFIGAVALLLVAAVAPWLIVQMFPIVGAGGLGALRGLFSAAQGMQAAGGLGRSIGAAAKGGVSRAAALAQTMSGNAGSETAPATSKAAPGGGSNSAGGNGSGTGGNSGQGKFGTSSGGSAPSVGSTAAARPAVTKGGPPATPPPASSDGNAGSATPDPAAPGNPPADADSGSNAGPARPAPGAADPDGSNPGAAPQVGSSSDVTTAPRVSSAVPGGAPSSPPGPSATGKAGAAAGSGAVRPAPAADGAGPASPGQPKAVAAADRHPQTGAPATSASPRPAGPVAIPPGTSGSGGDSGSATAGAPATPPSTATPAAIPPPPPTAAPAAIPPARSGSSGESGSASSSAPAPKGGSTTGGPQGAPSAAPRPGDQRAANPTRPRHESSSGQAPAGSPQAPPAPAPGRPASAPPPPPSAPPPAAGTTPPRTNAPPRRRPDTGSTRGNGDKR